MKAILLVTIFLSAMPSEAAKIGDYAKARFETLRDGKLEISIESRELVDYDPAKKYFKQVTTTVQNGKITVYEKWVGGVLFYDDESAAVDIANCKADGGSVENLNTPAGTIKTCHTHFGNVYPPILSNIWVGVVPFGEVKWDTFMDGMHQTMTLLEYRYGPE